jgi:thiamine-monophosphate kinase
MKLADLGEFGLIERITPGCVVESARVVKGIGDDCAVIRQEDPALWQLVTTDMLVEGVHFRREDLSPQQLGAKSLAVNLSDIAAMGGTPKDAFISLAISDEVSVEFVEGLYAGMKTMAAHHGVNLLGGDTTASLSGLVISITLTGNVRPEEVLLRSGAQVGDTIFVTGPLGDAAAGLHALLHGPVERDPAANLLVTRHLEPQPHLALARAIAATRLAHSMIDISDGLAADLGHICQQSGVGCLLEESLLPLSDELCSYCRHRGLNPLHLALGGGEDYVLLLTASPELARSPQLQHLALFPIGRIVAGAARMVRDRLGQVTPLSALGWDHFRR